MRRSITLCACVLALLTVGCGPSAPTYVSTAPGERTLVVEATAAVEVAPDEACIELTLAKHDASIAHADAELSRSLAELLTALRAEHDLVVETGAVQFAPEYIGGGLPGVPQQLSYVASAQVNVRVRDFPRIPAVIARAASAGLERAQVVYYSTHLSARRDEVRARAIEAVRAKAQALAAGMGVSLGEVLTIEAGDPSTSSGVSTGNYLARAMADSSPETPAPPGSIPLVGQMRVVYRLR